MPMNQHIVKGQIIPAPPCFTFEQLEVADWFIFNFLPDLTEFAREVTTIERWAGVTYPHALVRKCGDQIIRQYGTSITVN
jgi:hypothetical protein